MNDQLRKRGIERVIGEPQLLGGGKPDIYPGQPFTHGGGERRGRFHRADRVRAGPAHQLSRQRAWPASHVQDPLAAANPGQISELRRERLGVLAHEPQVGVRADVEAHQGNLPRRRR